MSTTRLSMLALVLTLILVPSSAFADEGHPSLTLEEAVESVMSSQNIDDPADIECDDVSEEQFAVVGDAFMAVMHPDEEEHARMDAMMGGEGSPQLAAMHAAMGSRYLGCAYGSYGMMGGMMGGGMMGASFSDSGYGAYPRGMTGGGMMGASYGASAWVTPMLLWTFLLLGIIWFLRELLGGANKKK